MGLVASISDRVGDLGAYLREQRENAKLSVRQLASLTGVSNPYLSQVERGLRHPSAEVLQQLAKGLRISAEALYVRAGILDDGPRGTVEAAVDADEGLTSRQKKVLLELCAHFRSENARAETTPDETEPTRADTTRTRPRMTTRTTTTTTTTGKAADKTAGKTAGKAADKTADKAADKTAAKTAAKTAGKTAGKTATRARTMAARTKARTTSRSKASADASTNANPENDTAPSSR